MLNNKQNNTSPCSQRIVIVWMWTRPNRNINNEMLHSRIRMWMQNIYVWIEWINKTNESKMKTNFENRMNEYNATDGHSSIKGAQNHSDEIVKCFELRENVMNTWIKIHFFLHGRFGHLPLSFSNWIMNIFLSITLFRASRVGFTLHTASIARPYVIWRLTEIIMFDSLCLMDVERTSSESGVLCHWNLPFQLNHSSLLISAAKCKYIWIWNHNNME